MPSPVNSYSVGVPFSKTPPYPIYSSRAPTSTDKAYIIGQLWIHKTGASSSEVYIFGGINGIGGGIWNISSGNQYIVGPSGEGSYSTIQAAVNAAQADGASRSTPKSIFILGGSYTENITVGDGINLIGYAGDPGYVGFLSAVGLPPLNFQPSVTVVGSLTVDTEDDVTDTYNWFANISFTPASGNVFTFLSSIANGSCVAFSGCSLVANGTSGAAMVGDGYPTVYLINSSVMDNGTTNSLISLPGTYKFFQLKATNSNFLINSETPLVLPAACDLLFNLTGCNYQSMINLSTATGGSFGIEATDTTFASDGGAGVAFLNYGAEAGRLYMNGCYCNGVSGPLVTSTGTSSDSFVEITNSLIQGSITAVNTSITNSSYFAAPSTYTQVMKGISTAYQGSESISGQSGVQTPSNVETTVFSVVLSELESLTLEGRVCSSTSDHANTVGGNFLIVARRASAGNVTLVGSVVTNVESSSAATFTCDVDTATQSVRVRVTGVAATVYNWVCTYSYFKVKTSS